MWKYVKAIQSLRMMDDSDTDLNLKITIIKNFLLAKMHLKNIGYTDDEIQDIDSRVLYKKDDEDDEDAGRKMSSMSKKYCSSTSPRKMGFSQKASCKAQGLLKRTSKKYNGKYVISPKYKSKRRSKRRKSRK